MDKKYKEKSGMKTWYTKGETNDEKPSLGFVLINYYMITYII